MAVIHSETWTGSDGAAWPSQWAVRNVSGSGTSSIQGNTGRLIATGASYAQRVALLDGSNEDDFELLISYASGTNGVNEAYADIFYRIGSGVSSGSPGSGYVVEITPYNDDFVGLYSLDSDSEYTEIATVSDAGVDTTARIWVRIRVEGDRHRVKWWAASGSEPGTWQIDETDASYSAGRFLLGNFNGNSGAARQVDWDDLSIDNLVSATVTVDPVPAVVAPRAAVAGVTATGVVAPSAAVVQPRAAVATVVATGVVAPVPAVVAARAGVASLAVVPVVNPVPAVVAARAAVATVTATGVVAPSPAVVAPRAAVATVTATAVIDPAPAVVAARAAVAAVDTALIWETWTGDDDDPWDSANWVEIRNDFGEGSATIQGNTGRLTSSAGVNASQVANANIDDIVSFDVTFRWRWSGLITGHGGWAIIYRYLGNELENYPNQGWVIGAYTFDADYSNYSFGHYGTGTEYNDVYSDETVHHHDTDWRWYRLLVVGGRHRGKWWDDGDPEPEEWEFDETSSLFLDPGPWSIAFYCGAAGNEASCEFDDLILRAVDVPSVDPLPAVVQPRAAVATVTATGVVAPVAAVVQPQAAVATVTATTTVNPAPAIVQAVAAVAEISHTPRIHPAPAVVASVAATATVTATAVIDPAPAVVAAVAGVAGVSAQPTVDPLPAIAQPRAAVAVVTATAIVNPSAAYVVAVAAVGNVVTTAEVDPAPAVVESRAAVAVVVATGIVTPTGAVVTAHAAVAGVVSTRTVIPRPAVVAITAGTATVTATAQIAAVAAYVVAVAAIANVILGNTAPVIVGALRTVDLTPARGTRDLTVARTTLELHP